MGVPVISSWSLAKATMLPANETEPITMLKTLGNAAAKEGCWPKLSSSATATSAAAPPPTPLKRATICGMAVIFTMRAPMLPTAAPMTTPIAMMITPEVVKRSSGSVAASAITMPTAAMRLPLRAPLGELSCFKPRMKQTAATRYASSMSVLTGGSLAVSTWSFSRGRFFGRVRLRLILGALRAPGGLVAPFEHLQHPVGNDETADHVGGGESHSEQPQDDIDRRARPRRDDDRSHQDDPVDRVGSRHQGRVENRRHLRDDLDPDEDRQHEEGQLVDQLVAHFAGSRSCLARSLTISPPCVTQLPLVISSSKSRVMAPSLTRWRSRFATLRANSWLVASGIVEGTLRVPMMVTPATSTSLPAWVSSTLPPVSAARSTMTEPGRMPCTISAVTNTGARRPGMAAVVMTTSDLATCSPISSRCLRRNSSDCSRA